MQRYPQSREAAQASRNKSALSPETPRKDSPRQRVWSKDSYADDYAGGIYENRIKDIGSIIPPPPATIISRPLSKCVPATPNETSYPQQESRAFRRSPTTLLPPTNAQSPQHSPTKEKSASSFMPTFTGDKESSGRTGISGWFTGSSAPVPLGISMADDDDLTSQQGTVAKDMSVASQIEKLQRRPTLLKMEFTASASRVGVSRFNFFGPKTPVTKTVQIPATMDDEFLTLDINSALFPAGAPTERDPFSPAAFKNLLMNAEGLLLKLQTAYKIRTLSLLEITEEKDAQSDELDEAETRAKHLKSQLEDMSVKLEEYDTTISELNHDLAMEKRARAEERAVSEKSIATLRHNCEDLSKQIGLEEDLGISRAGTRKHKWRTSNGSTDMSAEGDSDVEDCMSGGGDSVFSRPLSPTSIDSSATSIMTRETTSEIQQTSLARTANDQNSLSTRLSKPVQPTSTFQKILQGIGATDQASGNVSGLGLTDGCSNCRGKESSVAWDTVGLLRAENRGLKERVGDLEIVVDDALAICSGVKLNFRRG